MSTELHKIETLRGTLQVTEICGPENDVMLQLCQGVGNHGNPDSPGFLQFKLAEVANIVPILVEWLKNESHRRAEILRDKIATDADLLKTVFSEAADCERFIAEFKIPALCASQLARIATTL